MGVRKMCIQMYHPIDIELEELKKYYGKDKWNNGDFIRWLIHNLYLSLMEKHGWKRNPKR